MNWEDTFYKITEFIEKEDGFRSIVELMEKHPIYDGHFPLEPIVPGVCTLTIIRKCISIYSQKKVSFDKIKECKFISVVRPSYGLSIVIDITMTGENVVSAIVYNKDNIVLKLKALIK